VKITHIFFDVNETLTDFSSLVPSFARLGLSHSEMELWFSRVLRDGFALATANDSASFAEIGRASLAMLIAEKEIDASKEMQEAVLDNLSALPPHNDVEKCFRSLKSAGIQISTFSNGSATNALTLLDGMKCTNLVSNILTVQGHSLWKPHQSAYLYALEAAGVSAAESALVAVHPWDIHGAQRAGLAGIWVNRQGSKYPPFFEKPTFEVASLEKITEVIHN
jgi:2-haloacid dehalogenase